MRRCCSLALAAYVLFATRVAWGTESGEHALPAGPLSPSAVVAAPALVGQPALESAMSVPVFGQRWDPWGGNQLGTCSDTISSSGCAITSIAMIMKYYGVDTNPGDLNTWLTDNDGYSGGCLVKWGSPPGHSGGKMTYEGSAGADFNAINDEVDSGYPCVVQVRLSGYTHYVCCTGRSGGTYYINDPWYGDTSTLNDRYGSTIYSVQKYHGSTGCDTPIGNGSSEAGHFVDCYNRNGGRANVGCPAEFGGSKNAHWWGCVVIQDFDGGPFGRSAIIDNEGVAHSTAYCVHGAIWSKYASMGSTSVLGRPLSDELAAAGSPQGTGGRLNRFEGGSIYYSGPYGAYAVYGGISAIYEAAGGTASAYGFPINDAYAWHGGVRQDFEGGYIPYGADASAPTLSLTPAEISGWYTSPQSVSWNVSDPSGLDAVQVWWNQGPVFSNGASGSTAMLEGQQAFHVWARDAYGNAGQTDRTYRLDTSIPTVTASLSPSAPTGSNGWYNTGPTLTVTGADTTSGIENLFYRFDGGTYTAYASPVTMPEGVHSYQGKARDYAGNQGESTTLNAKLDTAVPTVSAILTPSQPDGQNGWYATAPLLEVVAVDPNGADGSGIDQRFYTLDGTEVTYVTPIAISTGIRAYSARATDLAGNSGATAVQGIKVDTTPPVFDSIYTDAESRSLGALAATWSCSDADSGVADYQYWIGSTAGASDIVGATLTGGNNWAYAMNLNLTPGQTCYFSVRARNIAGLWSSVLTSAVITIVAGQYDAAPELNSGGVSSTDSARSSTNYKIMDSVGQFVVCASGSPNFVIEHGYWHSDISCFAADGPGQAKLIANGYTIQLGSQAKPVVVISGTSTFADRFYVESADRISGLACQYGAAGGPALVEGDRVYLIGKLNTIANERVLEFASPVIVSQSDPLRPFYMNAPSVGGKGLNEWTPGVFGGIGLNNIGMLIKTIGGLVTYRDPQGKFFYVDNGDGLWDGYRYGVRVICDNFVGGGKLTMPAYGKTCVVTGISSVATVNSQCVRAIRPRQQSDIQEW